MRANRLVFCSALWLCAFAEAQAAEFPVVAVVGSGGPGGRVFVDLTYRYTASFSVISEDFQFVYEGADLNFAREASTVQSGASVQSWADYVTGLRTVALAHQGNLLENTNPALPQAGFKGYALSFYTADGTGHVRGGDVVVHLAFDISAAAVGGPRLLSFPAANVIVDAAEVEYTYPAALRSLSITVTSVVPEVSTAYSLLGGLIGVMGWARRRRSAVAPA